jgi:Na+/proline symporter
MSLGGIELEKDREFAHYIINELPIGLRGLLLAGVLSAAMSTLSSSINSLASSTLRDWFKKDADLKTAQKTSAVWAAVLIGIAMIFDESDKAIVEMGLQIASYTYGGLLSLFIISKLKRQFNSISIMIGLLSSFLAVYVAQQNGIAWTWFILLAVVVNIAVVFTSQSVFFRRHDA